MNIANVINYMLESFNFGEQTS